MYQNDPESHLRQLAELTRPLGALSLLTAGLYGKQARFGAKPDTKNLKSIERSGRYKGNMNMEVSAYTPREITDLLRGAGFNVLDWFGVRIFTDNDKRKIAKLKLEKLATILKTEISLSNVEEAKGIGQMLHFIARKK